MLAGCLGTELLKDRVLRWPRGPSFTAPSNSGFICIALAASAGLGMKGDQGWVTAQNSGWERKGWVGQTVWGPWCQKGLKEDKLWLLQSYLCLAPGWRIWSDSGAEEGEQVRVWGRYGWAQAEKRSVSEWGLMTQSLLFCFLPPYADWWLQRAWPLWEGQPSFRAAGWVVNSLNHREGIGGLAAASCPWLSSLIWLLLKNLVARAWGSLTQTVHSKLLLARVAFYPCEVEGSTQAPRPFSEHTDDQVGPSDYSG